MRECAAQRWRILSFRPLPTLRTCTLSPMGRRVHSSCATAILLAALSPFLHARAARRAANGPLFSSVSSPCLLFLPSSAPAAPSTCSSFLSRMLTTSSSVALALIDAATFPIWLHACLSWRSSLASWASESSTANLLLVYSSSRRVRHLPTYPSAGGSRSMNGVCVGRILMAPLSALKAMDIDTLGPPSTLLPPPVKPSSVTSIMLLSRICYMT